VTKLKVGTVSQAIVSLQLNLPRLLCIVLLFAGTVESKLDITKGVYEIGTNKSGGGLEFCLGHILDQIIDLGSITCDENARNIVFIVEGWLFTFASPLRL
jgi:hypothetical protein